MTQKTSHVTFHVSLEDSESFSGPRDCVHSVPYTFRLINMVGAVAVSITGLSGIQQPSAVFERAIDMLYQPTQEGPSVSGGYVQADLQWSAKDPHPWVRLGEGGRVEGRCRRSEE